MAKVTLVMKVRVSWWVRFYLKSVALGAWLTLASPDMEKVKRTVLRGIHIERR